MAPSDLSDLIFFHCALKRMIMLPCKIHHLRNFRFRDFIGKYATYADAVLMHMQHYAG